MISVIIPTFNKPEVLKKCLQALQEQTWTDFEIIVVDDGSNDKEGVRNIVEQFSVTQFIQQSNQGAPRARNEGFKASNGEYVIFLDDDVVLKPQALEKMYNVIEYSQVDFVYSSFKLGLKKMPSQVFDINSLRKMNDIHTSSLIKRSSFPGFDESLKRFQDWDLWLTITSRGGKGQFINEFLFEIIDTNGTISTWWPSFVYKLPWPILGFFPKSIKWYLDAVDIIRKKHGI